MGLGPRGVRVDDGRPGHSLGEDPGPAIVIRTSPGGPYPPRYALGDYAHLDNLSKEDREITGGEAPVLS